MLLLCRSSCSTTCDEAPLTSAANAEEEVPYLPLTNSLFPDAGPMRCENEARADTETWALPAMQQASQSKKRSLVRSTTASGSWSKVSWAAHWTSASVRVSCAPFIAAIILILSCEFVASRISDSAKAKNKMACFIGTVAASGGGAITARGCWDRQLENVASDESSVLRSMHKFWGFADGRYGLLLTAKGCRY